MPLSKKGLRGQVPQAHLADKRHTMTFRDNGIWFSGIWLVVCDTVRMNETLRGSSNLVRPLWHDPVHILSLPAVCGAQWQTMHLLNSPASPVGPYLTFPSSA